MGIGCSLFPTTVALNCPGGVQGNPGVVQRGGALPCLVDGFVSAAPLLTLAKLPRLTQPTASQTGQEATGPREGR